jgi:Kelch motif
MRTPGLPVTRLGKRRETRVHPLIAGAIALLSLAACTQSHARSAVATARPSPPAPDSPVQAQKSPLLGSAPESSAPQASSPAASTPVTATPSPAITATMLPVRLPLALSRLVAVAVGDRVIIAGGLNPQQTTTAQLSWFDPGAGSITPTGKLPVAVHDAGGALLGGAAFVVGGGSAASSDAVQEVRADGSAVIVGHLPQVRSDDAVAVAGSVLYVVGGYDSTRELPGVLATTDGVTFRQVGQLSETVRYGSAYASASAVWVFGGEHQGTTIPDIQRVDTATGLSTVVAHFPHPLAHAAVAVIRNRVLILGGTDGHNRQHTIYAFDPLTNEVSVVGSLPESVSDMAVAVVADTAYIIGGDALTAEQTVAPTTALVRVSIETD